MPEDVAARINEAKAQGRRVIAVGTTSLRTLESAADRIGHVEAGARDTRLFIMPGYKFRIVDALVTNFHLPKSTLVMLVSALSAASGFSRRMPMPCVSIIGSSATATPASLKRPAGPDRTPGVKRNGIQLYGQDAVRQSPPRYA